MDTRVSSPVSSSMGIRHSNFVDCLFPLLVPDLSNPWELPTNPNPSNGVIDFWRGVLLPSRKSLRIPVPDSTLWPAGFAAGHSCPVPVVCCRHADPAWRHVWLKGPPSLEAMREYVVAGLNYPPSQYQLHLQFMVLPLRPGPRGQRLVAGTRTLIPIAVRWKMSLP